MIRGAILTLGVVVAFGGVGAARGDELSPSGWPWLWPSMSSMTEVFPRLPENWSDLPLQLHLSESAGYNSNITNTPTGPGASDLLYGHPIGGMESISTYGASFKKQWGGQQLFGDASWGMYRYLNNGRFNSAHSSVDVGDNFTLGSKCKGTLRASEASAPSLPGQQIGFNVINTVTTISVTENAQCLINGEYSWILNSGTTSTDNTAKDDKQNNYQSVFVAAGINYAVSETNSLEVLATITGTDYTDRQTVSQQSGLVNNLTTDQLMATYTKNFGPNISLNAQVGLIGFSYSYFSFGMPRTVLPQYSFSAKWAATPKLTLNATVSRLASPPTSIVSNLQTTDAATAGFAYAWTPKVTLSGNLQTAYSTGSVATSGAEQVLNTRAANQRLYGATASLAYAVTPFLAANLSYQYFKTVQSNLTTNGSLFLLALNFNPY